MLESIHTAVVQATSIGPIALRAIESGMPGRVEAVFDRSFYVRFEELWICVCRSGLGRGPINVTCDAWNVTTPLSEFIHPGETTIGGTLAFGKKLTILTAGTERWLPAQLGPVDPITLRRGLAVLKTILPPVPADGLAGSIWFRRIDTSLTRKAFPSIEYLSTLLGQGVMGTKLTIQPELITPLLGLGPGLTPSGDDYLGGALVALHAVGHQKVAQQIWSAIVPFASVCTNDISFAHLRAAADGYGSAALHALINDLATGGSATTSEKAAALLMTGHTSGWDTLAGAICTLRVLNRTVLAPAPRLRSAVERKQRGLDDPAPTTQVGLAEAEPLVERLHPDD